MPFGTLTALVAALVTGIVVLVVAERPVGATFPGQNGRIAFVSERVTSESPEGDLEIYTMKSNGSDVVQLTRNAATDYSPAWSPNGRKIAFRSDRNGNDEIFVMRANGTDPTRLTVEAEKDSGSDWQPLRAPSP